MIYEYSYLNQNQGGGEAYAALCLHACYAMGDELRVEVPDSLCGHPIQKLAPYAFSASPGYGKGNDVHLFTADSLDAPLLRPAKNSLPDAATTAAASQADCKTTPAILFNVPETEIDKSQLPPRIAGDRLLSLHLPASLSQIGRYAFYNCTKLNALSLSSRTDLGSGLFTGCDAVQQLDVLMDETRRSCLQELLLAFHNPLLLRYWTPAASAVSNTAPPEPSAALEHGMIDPAQMPVAAQKSAAPLLKYCLIFPQYYENAGENTPARITVRDLHGSGLFYRNCFADTQFQIERYDQPFAHAEANEPEAVTTALAFCRLLIPTGLSDAAGERYRAYLRLHPAALTRCILTGFQNGSYETLALRAVLVPPLLDAGLMDQLIDELTKLPAAPAALVSLFMDIKKQKFGTAPKKRRFELL